MATFNWSCTIKKETVFLFLLCYEKEHAAAHQLSHESTVLSCACEWRVKPCVKLLTKSHSSPHIFITECSHTWWMISGPSIQSFWLFCKINFHEQRAVDSGWLIIDLLSRDPSARLSIRRTVFMKTLREDDFEEIKTRHCSRLRAFILTVGATFNFYHILPISTSSTWQMEQPSEVAVPCDQRQNIAVSARGKIWVLMCFPKVTLSLSCQGRGTTDLSPLCMCVCVCARTLACLSNPQPWHRASSSIMNEKVLWNAL